MFPQVQRTRFTHTFSIGCQAYGMIPYLEGTDEILVISTHEQWGPKESFGYVDTEHWTFLPFTFL